jgi:two-component system sensor histidine kinase ChvG
MASAIATAKPEQSATGARRPVRRIWPFGSSRLGRVIVVVNFIGLLILVIGALVLNEISRGLINTRLQSLTAQGELIANVIAELSTRGEPSPTLESEGALLAFQKTFVPQGQRARLFDVDGNLIADSYLVSDAVEEQRLPPARARGVPAPPPPDREGMERRQQQAKAALDKEVHDALLGIPVHEMRRTASGERVVSVAIPVSRVKRVVGVLVLEAGDVDQILWAQRRALAPFILVAFAGTILSSVLLHFIVVRPITRLSAAADQVRLSQARAISLPDLEERNDELADLARSLESMTDTLSNRMDAIERFAADVSHEIKNPLTSVRSAVETLELVHDEKAKARLMALLKQDVRRMDRLITDISNASRLDAELSRETPRPVDVARLLSEIVGLYGASERPNEPHVALSAEPGRALYVSGREGPFGQVFRNLIDNAKSFSAEDAEVRVSVSRNGADPARPILITVDDDGPGIPEENLETVFERFYTSRPKGQAFGGNSGLGLSIARQIVLAHGGRIWAENRKDASGKVLGARFIVSLPDATART